MVNFGLISTLTPPFLAYLRIGWLYKLEFRIAPATTTVSASATVAASPARTTVQPPRPSVAVAPSPATLAAAPTSTTAPSSNAAKIAELESLLADLGPVHPSGSAASRASPATANGAPSSFSASSTTTTSSAGASAPRATSPVNSSYNSSSSHSTTSSAGPSSTAGAQVPRGPTSNGAPSSTTTNTSSFSSTTHNNNNNNNASPRAQAPGGNDGRSTRTASVSVSKTAAPASGDVVCGKCHEKISGTYIAALDKNWHPDHFTCSSCSKSLDGNFFETDKGILCTDCASEQIRCTECRLPITGTHLIYSDGRPVHNECVPKSSCGRCHNLLSLGDAHVEALDKLWHPECFACTRCMTPLGSTFVQYEGTPYCQPCIQILSKERNIVFKS